MKPADRMLSRNVAAPGLLALGARRADECKAHPVGIGEREHALAEALLQRMRHAVLDEAMRPVTERGRRDAEDRLLRLADAEVAGRRMLPREKGQDRAGLALLVTVIKVPGAGIVEVHGFLDQPKPERAGIEVEIAVGPARNRRDVMDA